MLAATPVYQKEARRHRNAFGPSLLQASTLSLPFLQHIPRQVRNAVNLDQDGGSLPFRVPVQFRLHRAVHHVVTDGAGLVNLCLAVKPP